MKDFFKKLGRGALGVAYLSIPVLGWYWLAKSFHRLNPEEISSIRNFSGKTEIIEKPGLYFRPFPGDEFGKKFNKTKPFIDFGALKRIFIRQGEKGVKTDAEGKNIILNEGYHLIATQDGEIFDETTGIQSINQDDYTLGDRRFVTIHQDELGAVFHPQKKLNLAGNEESKGEFVLLQPGLHEIQLPSRFEKKAKINQDIVDLGAITILTVKPGEVAFIRAKEKIKLLEEGVHTIEQMKGESYLNKINTGQQGVDIPSLKVLCSDRIEMQADSILVYEITDPLQTLSLGLEKIVPLLQKIAEGTLRTILSKFSSSDIAPSLHTDEEHDSNKRNQKLSELHDECVKELNKHTNQWGIKVNELQIVEILPADEEYLKAIRNLGNNQATAESDRKLAEIKASIAKIEAEAEQSRVVAAKIEQEEALVRADTKAQEKGLEVRAETNKILAVAEANAQAVEIEAGAEAKRIGLMNDATRDAPPIVHDLMRIKAHGNAQSEMLERAQNPILAWPNGDSTVFVSSQTGNMHQFFHRQPAVATMLPQSLSAPVISI